MRSTPVTLAFVIWAVLYAWTSAQGPSGSATAVSDDGRMHVIVVRGDTLSSIARAHGLTVAELSKLNGLTSDVIVPGQRLVVRDHAGWSTYLVPAGATWNDVALSVERTVVRLVTANPSVVDPAGQQVRVPPPRGTLATPREGEDLIAFAARHGTSPGTIVELNGLTPPYRTDPLMPWVVDALGDDEVVAAAATSGAGWRAIGDVPENEALRPTPLDHAQLRDEAFDALLANLRDVRLVPPSMNVFAWPLAEQARLTSPFGWRNLSVAGNRFHFGVDLAASTGTGVRAARSGVVARSGWMGSYGFAVILDHGDGYETRYAHLSVVDVVDGARITAGQTIGRVGSTGASTGPHLHFEIRRWGSALDPLALLPPRTTSTQRRPRARSSARTHRSALNRRVRQDIVVGDGAT